MKTNLKNTLMLSMMTLLLLASCGGDGTAAVTDAVTASASTDTTPVTEESIQPNLPDTDWGGRTFMVLGRENPSYSQFNNMEIFAENETGDTVGDAVYRRNVKLEDKYNVKIEQTVYDLPQDELQKSASAGDHLYDLAFVELIHLGSAIQSGYFYDLNTVEHIDFSKPWWNPDVNEKVSLCGKLYATTSDFSLRDKNRAYILLYNIPLAETYDLPNLVQTVRDGKWTIDEALSIAKQFGADLDGDGKMGGEHDMFGLTMDSYNAFTTFVIGCDNLFITKDTDDRPVLALDSDRLSNTVDRVMELTCDSTIALFCNDFEGKVSGDHWSVSGNSFYAEHALMMAAFPHSLKSSSEKAEFDYGVLPFPKYDEAQDGYYTYADIFCMMFGIPVTSPEPAFSGFMLEALSAASTDTTLKAYYDVSCKTKYSYNEETGEMLDLVFSGIRYDLARIYNITSITNIFSVDLPKKKENILASQIEKNAKKTQTALDKLVTALEEMEH